MTRRRILGVEYKIFARYFGIVTFFIRKFFVHNKGHKMTKFKRRQSFRYLCAGFTRIGLIHTE
jgi:hypothetical protein